MNPRLRICTAFGLFVLCTMLRAAAPAVEPIKFGHIASLTGKEAAFGVATRKGILLAIVGSSTSLKTSNRSPAKRRRRQKS